MFISSVMICQKYKGGALYPNAAPKLDHGPAKPFLLFSFLFCILLTASGCAVKQDNATALPQHSTPRSAVAYSPTVNETSVVAAAKSTIGSRYKYGGTSPETGFDCSGLVCWSFEQVGVKVPRRAKEQLNAGNRIKSSELRPGDIVVFKGTNNRSGWHSGIYSGNGKFVHSPSSGKTVTESSLSDDYFARRYAGASRVLPDASGALMAASGIMGEGSSAASASGPVFEDDILVAQANGSGSTEADARIGKKSAQAVKGKAGKQNKSLVASKSKKGKQSKAVASAKSKKGSQAKTLASAAGKTTKASKKAAPAKGKKSKQAAAATKQKAASATVKTAAKSNSPKSAKKQKTAQPKPQASNSKAKQVHSSLAAPKKQDAPAKS